MFLGDSSGYQSLLHAFTQAACQTPATLRFPQPSLGNSITSLAKIGHNFPLQLRIQMCAQEIELQVLKVQTDNFCQHIPGSNLLSTIHKNPGDRAAELRRSHRTPRWRHINNTIHDNRFRQSQRGRRLQREPNVAGCLIADSQHALREKTAKLMTSLRDNAIPREQIAAAHFDEVSHTLPENDRLLLVGRCHLCLLFFDKHKPFGTIANDSQHGDDNLLARVPDF